jgi:multidrug resistance efflux pump
MSEAQTTAKSTKTADERAAVWSPDLPAGPKVRPRLSIVPVLITLTTVALAIPLGWAMWDAYVGVPWTRDGTVRVYVVTMAPEVAGRIVKFPVADNQFVHKGDLLMVIDPRDYRIAVSRAEAAVKQAEANARNAEIQSQRRQKLNQLAVTIEEQQTYATAAVAAQAQYQQTLANLDQARVNLERTQVRSPVNGWVTHLLAQLGDYAMSGKI